MNIFLTNHLYYSGAFIQIFKEFLMLINFQVKQKVEDIRGMLAGTKTSVDHLMPKSEELLTQSQRQERAISNIHNDLTEKTNAIINELSQVQYKKY